MITVSEERDPRCEEIEISVVIKRPQLRYAHNQARIPQNDGYGDENLRAE